MSNYRCSIVSDAWNFVYRSSIPASRRAALFNRHAGATGDDWQDGCFWTATTISASWCWICCSWSSYFCSLSWQNYAAALVRAVIDTLVRLEFKAPASHGRLRWVEATNFQVELAFVESSLQFVARTLTVKQTFHYYSNSITSVSAFEVYSSFKESESCVYIIGCFTFFLCRCWSFMLLRTRCEHKLSLPCVISTSLLSLALDCVSVTGFNPSPHTNVCFLFVVAII